MKEIQNRGLLPPIIVTIVMGVMFLSYLSHVSDELTSVSKEIKNKHAVVLDKTCAINVLSDIICNNGYSETKSDADFIAEVLIRRQEEMGRLPNLYALQKRDIGQVSASLVDSCRVLVSRHNESCDNLGQNDSIFPFVVDSAYGARGGKIMAKVYKKVTSSSKIIPCKDVPVRITSHFRDTLGLACSEVLGYAVTDSQGVAVFDVLNTQLSYSVLPIKRGFEYGASQGTIGGKWSSKKKDSSIVLSFEEKEHKIPLFSNATLQQIKSDQTILARSPKEFIEDVVKWFVFVLLAWWTVCLYLSSKRRRINGTLLASCMFLTCLSVLEMFSMQDPLNDEMHGETMGQGVIIGLVICLIFQKIDFIKFYQNNSMVSFDIPIDIFRWIFMPYKIKIKVIANILKSDTASVFAKMLAVILVLLTLPFLILDIIYLILYLIHIPRLHKAIDTLCSRLPKGIGWLFLALLLTSLLWTPLGRSIGGMRVNLNIFGLVFQPSEIAKYLIMLFMAALFTQKADTIIAYSQPNRISKLGSKLSTLFWIILGLLIILALYVKLEDMGPSLVLGITFIILYSMIKSKVYLDNLNEDDKWKRILSCDFAMLIYGVITFAVFLLIGYKLGNMMLFGSIWFVFWIVLGYVALKKQLFESALLLNAVIFIFIFGGQILSCLPGLKDSSVVERFEERTKMCVNTWGELDIEHLGLNAEPVSNTQVANGLWALATGGIEGQGLGKGKPTVIPAFHTDMILSSIGEQLGWIGLLMIIIAYFILLRGMSVIGYRVGHPFAFYLCLGFAVVIGVQFFIIALGSSGIIPLTGVTVPFLSFGRVSMILNLSAFGIVLSLCNNIKESDTSVSNNIQYNTVERYSYPIAMVTLVFLFFSISTLGIWQYYQCWERGKTLIHYAYVINKQGAPVVEYNPRIKLLENNMYAGRIYDRNGTILATSDKSEIDLDYYDSLGIDKTKLTNMLKRNQKRYYPMGEHLFFMVGDQNEGLLFSYNENNPVGYMAEAQHLSHLRGFDNILYDRNGKPIKVNLETKQWNDNAYLTPKDTVFNHIPLWDYSELIKYLKDGIDGKKVSKHNEQVKNEEYDIHLTVDAALQVDIQNEMALYMSNHFKNNSKFHLMRASAVVLDANNGDLLASANYPLPDYKRIREERERGNVYYSDNYKKSNWQAYTDIDLGTTYATAPGSTAKVMSAVAAFMQCGANISNQTYYITSADAIELNKTGGVIEPHDENVTMLEAIKESSNCYFINLVNDKDLYSSLSNLYKYVGVSIGNIVPYYFNTKQNSSWEKQFDTKVAENRAIALTKYSNYIDDVKNGKHKKMDEAEWKWAWGQGYSHYDLLATPLNMARVTSIVVNNGKMPNTQYILSNKKHKKNYRNESEITVLTPEQAEILKGYMLEESKNQTNRQKKLCRTLNVENVIFPQYVGGKTGTPERARVLRDYKIYNRWTRQYGQQIDEEELNDGWYIFFVDKDEPYHDIAVALRIERGFGSGYAVILAEKVLLKCLYDHSYI